MESQERRQKTSQLHSFPGDKPGAETECLCVPLSSEPARGARGGSGDTTTGSRRGQQSRPTLFLQHSWHLPVSAPRSFSREKTTDCLRGKVEPEAQRRTLVKLQDFSVNLWDKRELHWMVWEITSGKHTIGARVSTGSGDRFFLQNPLSVRQDNCHRDWTLPRNGLLCRPSGWPFQSFLQKIIQVISFINGGFLLTNINCVPTKCQALGPNGRKGA